ncbi:MAG: amidohydrolase family protein [Alphaproteobacteria bacterium]|nr:amidohydrolase family protein [Alphaproteobacteria bacterium]
MILRRARIAPGLLSEPIALRDGWALADLAIEGNRIAAVMPASPGAGEDLDHGIVMPAFVDCHAHLDKTHMAADAVAGSLGLLAAIEAVEAHKRGWTADNLRARAEFALRCAYALGVRAVRSHVDWTASTAGFVWPVMTALRAAWAGRIELQLAPLMALDAVDDRALFEAAIAGAATGGRVVGFFVYGQERLRERIAQIATRALETGLDLDFHVDEGLDPTLVGVEAIADVLLATKFSRRVLLGHCVALSLLDDGALARVLAKLVAAKVGVVALPLTNLHLQDSDAARSPRRRGMAPLREIAAAGIDACVATDNVRDGFFPYGDHDPLAALGLASLVGHLPDPARLWASAITTAPARAMGLAWDGVLRAGAPADLVLFDARTSSELLAQGGRPRRVMRRGSFIDTRLPSLRELDAAA